MDLYLLTEPDFSFVQDGFCDGELIRLQMHQRFIELLPPDKTFRIGGTRQQRREQAVTAVNALLAKPFDL